MGYITMIAFLSGVFGILLALYSKHSKLPMAIVYAATLIAMSIMRLAESLR